ncbi:MAG: cytochrome c [Myxococcales bacterium]|nr:cytochrome c [Myxococcales bacterium]
MKTLLKVLGGLIVLVLLGAGGTFTWAKSTTADKLAQSYEAHTIDFPMPWPLSEAELAAIVKERAAEKAKAEAPAPAGDGAGEAPAEGGAPAEGEGAAEPAADPLEGIDLAAIAMERAVARGKHLVEARYACIECHGEDFSGGVMVDDPAMGKILGPNITTGKGGKTEGYTPADWDRIVRHGIKRDGKPAVMPSEDFQLMSDQELSDIIAYLQTAPAVDNEVPAVSLGPVGTMLMATGGLPLSADIVEDHDGAHPKLPPNSEPTAEFGKHLAGICTGCHRKTLEGGPIPVGPPDWPPAMNLTPHADGLEGWSFDDFKKAMTEGVRPDGTELKVPMTLVLPYAQKMKDVEMKALWEYISKLPPKPTGI